MDLHVILDDGKKDESIKNAFNSKKNSKDTNDSRAYVSVKNIKKLLLSHKNTNKFKSVFEAHTWAFPKYERWIKDLSKNEYTAIFKYCYGGSDKRINAFYKKKIENLSYEDKKVVEFLESALAKSRVPEDLVVYRGKRGDDFKEVLSMQKDKIIGKTIKQKGFMSTSLVESVAKRHERGMMLKINVPKGAKGGYVGTISEHLEAEILFGLDQEITIKKIEEKNNVTIIECDLKVKNDDMRETGSIYSISETESMYNVDAV